MSEKNTNRKIVMSISGGTTGQLYSAYIGYVIARKTDRELILDISSYSNGYHFPYALDYFDFNFKKLDYTWLSNEVLSEKSVPKEYIKDFNPTFITITRLSFEEIINKCVKQNKKDVIHLVGDEGVSTGYLEYFDDFKKMLITQHEQIFLDAFKEEIKDKISVGVFVRRNEYVTLGWSDDYAFYKAGINHFEEKYKDVEFYIFSDDLEDVKLNFGNQNNFHYVKFIGGADAHIEALFALASCNHSIVGTTGWSYYISILNNNKNSEHIRCFNNHVGKEKWGLSYHENDIIFDKTYINNYLLENSKKVINKKELARKKDIPNELQKIINYIQDDKIENARINIINLCFDTYYITLEQREVLTNLFEYICVNGGDFLRAEQSLLEHLYISPDSLQTNTNIARVKAVRNTYFEACMYAIKATRLDISDSTFNEMKELFDGTGYEEIFKYLSRTQKFHFVIAPLEESSFFTNNKDALIIWLTRMGHKVSVINPKIKVENLKNTPNKIKIAMNNISLKSDSNVVEYTIIIDNSIKEYSFDKLPMIDIINNIFSKSDLHGIFINRNINLQVNLPDNIPSIYWDFSCEGDRDKYNLKNAIQAIKGLEEKHVDKFMCRYKPAIITTDKSKVEFYQKLVIGNIFVHEKYTRSGYEIIDFKIDFEQTIISNELFLGFVVQVIEATERLVNQDISNLRKKEIEKLGYQSHALQLKQVPANSKVLEFGCSSGHVTGFMKNILNCDVTIIEYEQDLYNKAIKNAVDGICGDAEELKWLEKFKGQEFDIIFFGDVLEHLRRPEIVLENSKKLLKHGGKIVLSVPNNCCTSIMALQYLNVFHYTPLGLLDRTHIHLFSYELLCKIIKDCNLEIEIYDAMCMNALNTEFREYVKSLPKQVLDILENRPMSNVYQFVFTLVKPDPNNKINSINRIQERCDAVRKGLY